MKKNLKRISVIILSLLLCSCSMNPKLDAGFIYSKSHKLKSFVLVAYIFDKGTFKQSENIDIEVFLGYYGKNYDGYRFNNKLSLVIYDYNQSISNEKMIHDEEIEGFFTDENNYLGELKSPSKIKYNYSKIIAINPEILSNEKGTLGICGIETQDGEISGNCVYANYEKAKNIVFSKR